MICYSNHPLIVRSKTSLNLSRDLHEGLWRWFVIKFYLILLISGQRWRKFHQFLTNHRDRRLVFVLWWYKVLTNSVKIIKYTAVVECWWIEKCRWWRSEAFHHGLGGGKFNSHLCLRGLDRFIPRNDTWHAKKLSRNKVRFLESWFHAAGISATVSHESSRATCRSIRINHMDGGIWQHV